MRIFVGAFVLKETRYSLSRLKPELPEIHYKKVQYPKKIQFLGNHFGQMSLVCTYKSIFLFHLTFFALFALITEIKT